MSEKSILQLAKENQFERFIGKYHIKKTGTSRHYRDKDVTCIMCGRNMTAPEFENPPFYCYKCNEEAEAVLRDSCYNSEVGTPIENLERDKRIRDYEDYYNGKAYPGER